MNIQDTLKKRLVDNGFFPDAADEVIEAVKQDPCSEAMQKRWEDEQSDYPEVFINVLWVSVRRHALLWIDENLPMAWFRPMFADIEEG